MSMPDYCPRSTAGWTTRGGAKWDGDDATVQIGVSDPPAMARRIRMRFRRDAAPPPLCNATESTLEEIPRGSGTGTERAYRRETTSQNRPIVVGHFTKGDDDGPWREWCTTQLGSVLKGRCPFRPRGGDFVRPPIHIAARRRRRGTDWDGLP